MTTRRGFLAVLAGAVAAPYVARADVLMPVHTIAPTGPRLIVPDGIAYDELANGWYQISRIIEQPSRTWSANLLVKPPVIDGAVTLPNIGLSDDSPRPSLTLGGAGVELPGGVYHIGAAQIEVQSRETAAYQRAAYAPPPRAPRPSGMKHHPMRPPQHIRSPRHG